MRQEIGLVILFIFLFLYDTFYSKKGRKYFQLIAILLFGALTTYGFFYQLKGESFGGMYFNSTLTVWMKNILNIATLIIFLQSYQWLSLKNVCNKQGEFYTIVLVTLLGMYVMISSGNFMMLYIGMEMASLPLACLVSFDKYKEKSAEAGVKYILISAFSSGIMLFGLSFLYGGLGTFYLSEVMISNLSSPLVIFGFIFFLSGLGFKLSLVPFHLWTADVYEGAPTVVTAYLSVISKGAVFFTLIFILYKIFGSIVSIWHSILWGLSIITITLGNLFAIRQQEIKRFLAFSSISQAGYILLGIVAGTAQGMTAMIYFLLTYLFSNLAAFGVISAIECHAKGDTRIVAFNGLYKSNPSLTLVMTIAIFSLAGIPPFAGFFGKFFVFMSLGEQGLWVLLFFAVLNTVISLFYYLLIVKAMFICRSEDQVVSWFRINNYNRVGLIICTIGSLIVGIVSCIYKQIDSLSFGPLA